MADKNPQEVIVRGRLSYPSFTMADAIALNERSKIQQYKKKPEDVRPSFSLIVEQAALDKLTKHIDEVFLPYAEALHKADPKARGGLSPAQVTKLRKIIGEGDWEVDPLPGLIKHVPEKTAELAPEGVAVVKANGFKGRDMILKALVRDEDELANQHEDIIIPSRGVILSVEDTKHELYPGSVVSTQLNLYAYESMGAPGISASTSTVIYVGDAPRFGGGGDIDEDSFFMDLDD